MRADARGAASLRLTQRHYDLIALALVAGGVYLGFVMYGSWDGGKVGDWLARGLGRLIGQARVGVPVALVGGGTLLVLRPQLPSLRPLRAGALLVFAAATLGFAAAGPAQGTWSGAAHHGGLVGQAELWIIARLLGAGGAEVLAVFLGLAGILLLSGGSLTSAVRAGGSTLARYLAARRAKAAAAARARPRPAPITPPEPSDRELVVRATHVEAPAIEPDGFSMPAEFHDFASELADLGGDEAIEADAEPETMMPRRRRRPLNSS